MTHTDPDGRTAAVLLASAGRPFLLAEVMRDIDHLDGADGLRKIVSVPDVSSLPVGAGDGDDWQIVLGARGLAAQRNAALDAVPVGSTVFFFDDDAVIRRDFVVNALTFFESHPAVVGITGRVLLDGAVGGEIERTAAELEVEQSLGESLTGRWTRTRELYGCNFAVRTSAAPSLRFDERLPLYSWLEDHDFARRLMPRGTLAKVDDCVIVHRAAATGGRQAHVRLGYSQVMNPWYLWRKGSFPLWLMVNEAGRRVAKNVVFATRGPESRWRRRRLKGNLLAAGDIARGNITPERIVKL